MNSIRAVRQNYSACSRILEQVRLSSNNVIDLPDDPRIMIPPYIEKVGEDLDLRKARLLYQSRKRGMLENGLLLSTFAAKYLKDMNEKQVSEYDKLINQPSNDWEIFYWATGVKAIPDEFNNNIMKMFVEHVKNSKKEKRIRQPDLY